MKYTDSIDLVYVKPIDINNVKVNDKFYNFLI